MKAIEQILRSDYARHFLLMFFAVSLLMWVVTLPIWVLVAMIVIAPVTWELYGKYSRNIPVEIWDVVISIIGGVVAILT